MNDSGSPSKPAPGKFARRSRKASGPARQIYFAEGDVDRVMAVVLALASEVASIRERLDTHERLGNAGLPAAVDAVEAHRADEATEADRERWRDAYIARLFRVFTEDIESLSDAGNERPAG
jgi:hypothetical protein